VSTNHGSADGAATGEAIPGEEDAAGRFIEPRGRVGDHLRLHALIAGA
jgi:hypothetical protein